jgi:hypothetical protein
VLDTGVVFFCTNTNQKQYRASFLTNFDFWKIVITVADEHWIHKNGSFGNFPQEHAGRQYEDDHNENPN